MSKTSNNKHVLLMLDHDGTLCNTNENAFESIKSATISASQIFTKDFTGENLDWNLVFSQTVGTTESYYVRVVANIISIPINQLKLFEERYYTARKNWYQNMINLNEYVWDTYYPDAEKLLLDTSKQHKIKIIKYLVTGNPQQVINERIPQHVRYHFSDTKGNLNGTFGDEGLSRKDLILKTVEKAIKQQDFKPVCNGNRIITNAYYIADSKNDLYAGIEARVRTVWIPSRSLQHLIVENNTQEVKIFKRGI